MPTDVCRRTAPLAADAWSDETRAALAALLPSDRRNPRDAGNVLSRLVRHPAQAVNALRIEPEDLR